VVGVEEDGDARLEIGDVEVAAHGPCPTELARTSHLRPGRDVAERRQNRSVVRDAGGRDVTARISIIVRPGGTFSGVGSLSPPVGRP
jgi:hypothetical protein